MPRPVPNPSSRLVRAAEAERSDLRRLREEVTDQHEKALARVRELEATLAEVDERLQVLARIVPERTAPGGTQPERDAEETEKEVLRGPAIRETAVQVLRGRSPLIEALHYREWYELVLEAGYQVAGKDPLAVFLTQLGRSPVVRKTTQAGVYELDRNAVERLRRQLATLHSQLRDATVAAETPADLAEIRARRHDLEQAISQQERALEEALRVLADEETAQPTIATAG